MVVTLGGSDAAAHRLARRLIARGVPPDLAGPSGLTALHVASGSGNLEVARQLLSRGANPEAIVTTPTGQTFAPLQLAALAADPLLVAQLREAGASVGPWFLDLPGGRAVEALLLSSDWFAFERAIAEFPVLHYREAEQRYSWMEMACLVSSPRAVAGLLASGWEVSGRELAHAALWSNDLTILELLAAAGAPIWTTDAHGPLTMACCAASREKVAWLLQHGANANEGVGSADGLTPLDLAEAGLGQPADAGEGALAKMIRAAGGVKGWRPD